MLQRTWTVLRIRDVQSRTGLSRSTIYQRMSEDQFPQSIALGGRSIGWVESEINDWILERIETSRRASSR